MSKEKQIEEMAKHCHFCEKGKCLLLGDEEVDCDMECDICEFAKSLYNAGYRKQSENAVVLPYKVGQKVYVLRSKTSNGKNLYLREEQIDHYRIFGERSYMCFFSERLSVPNYLWEATVFLTQEEAEAKMKGGEQKQGMTDLDKMWIEKCKSDWRYTIEVDNGEIFVDDSETGECVYTFSLYGYYFVKALLEYIGCDADFV